MVTTTATSSATGPAGEDPRPVRRAPRPDPRGPVRRWAGRVAVAVAVALCAAVAFASLSGTWKVLRVPTGSMAPTIGEGSAILVESVPADDVSVGDVIVFHAPVSGDLTVHRVISLDRGQGELVVRTQGDANEAPDSWEARINGETVHRYRSNLPVLGDITSLFADGRVRLVVAAVSAGLVLAGGLHLIWGTGRNVYRIASDNARERARARHSRRTHRRRRRSVAAAVLVVAALGAGAIAVGASGSAEAAFTGATGTLQNVGSGVLLTPSSPACRWSSGTQVGVTWTMGPGGIQTGAEVIRTTLAGASPTSVATVSPATVGTATVTAPAPVTTPYRYAVQTTKAPWTSAPTTSMRSDECASAVNAFAGNGSSGFAGDGGPATAARLNAPQGLSTLPDGSVLIADTGNNRIRRVAPDGTISTFAGTGATTSCTYSGPVSGLRLVTPRGVAADPTGNVYIADSGNNCVRRVDAGGNVTQVAGGGATTPCASTVAAAAVSLSNPSDVAIDPGGDVIIADTNRDCIRRVSGGTVSRVAGGGGTTTCNATMPASAVSLSRPAAVSLTTTGDVIIADTNRNCIRRVSGTTVSHVAGGGGTTSCTVPSIAATAVSLSGPEGMEVDPLGRVIIADRGRRCLRLISGTTVVPLGFTGANSANGDGGPVQAATIRTPSALALEADGDVLVADRSTGSGSSDVRRIVTPLP